MAKTFQYFTLLIPEKKANKFDFCSVLWDIF